MSAAKFDFFESLVQFALNTRGLAKFPELKWDRPIKLWRFCTVEITSEHELRFCFRSGDMTDAMEEDIESLCAKRGAGNLTFTDFGVETILKDGLSLDEAKIRVFDFINFFETFVEAVEAESAAKSREATAQTDPGMIDEIFQHSMTSQTNIVLLKKLEPEESKRILYAHKLLWDQYSKIPKAEWTHPAGLGLYFRDDFEKYKKLFPFLEAVNMEGLRRELYAKAKG